MSKETKTTDIRDGSWIDKWGACRVCGGEIPEGHTNNCDLYKMECQIKNLERQRDEANERIKTLQGMYERFDLLVSTQQSYIEYLGEAEGQTIGFLMSHNWKYSAEFIQRGDSLREAIAVQERVIDDLKADRERVNHPIIVCLCGSTRFSEAFREWNLRETIAGKIVLSIGCNLKSDSDLIAAGLLKESDKAALDELHKRKIDLADEVLVLNVGGYIGSSTRSEIKYAIAHSKPIRYLEAIAQTKAKI